jgi:hypothetical protein
MGRRRKATDNRELKVNEQRTIWFRFWLDMEVPVPEPWPELEAPTGAAGAAAGVGAGEVAGGCAVKPPVGGGGTGVVLWPDMMGCCFLNMYPGSLLQLRVRRLGRCRPLPSMFCAAAPRDLEWRLKMG